MTHGAIQPLCAVLLCVALPLDLGRVHTGSLGTMPGGHQCEQDFSLVPVQKSGRGAQARVQGPLP